VRKDNHSQAHGFEPRTIFLFSFSRFGTNLLFGGVLHDRSRARYHVAVGSRAESSLPARRAVCMFFFFFSSPLDSTMLVGIYSGSVQTFIPPHRDNRDELDRSWFDGFDIARKKADTKRRYKRYFELVSGPVQVIVLY
jgi:hypothetical protein